VVPLAAKEGNPLGAVQMSPRLEADQLLMDESEDCGLPGLGAPLEPGILAMQVPDAGLATRDHDGLDRSEDPCQADKYPPDLDLVAAYDETCSDRASRGEKESDQHRQQDCRPTTQICAC